MIKMSIAWKEIDWLVYFLTRAVLDFICIFQSHHSIRSIEAVGFECFYWLLFIHARILLCFAVLVLYLANSLP